MISHANVESGCSFRKSRSKKTARQFPKLFRKQRVSNRPGLNVSRSKVKKPCTQFSLFRKYRSRRIFLAALLGLGLSQVQAAQDEWPGCSPEAKDRLNDLYGKVNSSGGNLEIKYASQEIEPGHLPKELPELLQYFPQPSEAKVGYDKMKARVLLDAASEKRPRYKWSREKVDKIVFIDGDGDLKNMFAKTKRVFKRSWEAYLKEANKYKAAKKAGFKTERNITLHEDVICKMCTQTEEEPSQIPVIDECRSAFFVIFCKTGSMGANNLTNMFGEKGLELLANHDRVWLCCDFPGQTPGSDGVKISELVDYRIWCLGSAIKHDPDLDGGRPKARYLTFAGDGFLVAHPEKRPHSSGKNEGFQISFTEFMGSTYNPNAPAAQATPGWYRESVSLYKRSEGTGNGEFLPGGHSGKNTREHQKRLEADVAKFINAINTRREDLHFLNESRKPLKNTVVQQMDAVREDGRDREDFVIPARDYLRLIDQQKIVDRVQDILAARHDKFADFYADQQKRAESNDPEALEVYRLVREAALKNGVRLVTVGNTPVPAFGFDSPGSESETSPTSNGSPSSVPGMSRDGSISDISMEGQMSTPAPKMKLPRRVILANLLTEIESPKRRLDASERDLPTLARNASEPLPRSTRRSSKSRSPGSRGSRTRSRSPRSRSPQRRTKSAIRGQRGGC